VVIADLLYNLINLLKLAQQQRAPGALRAAAGLATHPGCHTPIYGDPRLGTRRALRPAHGDTAFTVPLFDAFLRRIMPEFQAPPRAQS
jgi:hypothetical protein